MDPNHRIIDLTHYYYYFKNICVTTPKKKRWVSI